MILDDVTDALFDVLLLSVGIEVPRDRVQELNCLISRLLQLSFLAEQIVELGTTLGDLSGQLPCGSEVVDLALDVEVHAF